MPRKAVLEAIAATEIFVPKPPVVAEVDDPNTPVVRATVKLDDDGNVVITFPQTVKLDQLRRQKNGNPFVKVIGDATELLVTMDVPGGDRKERVMFTYPVVFRLGMKIG